MAKLQYSILLFILLIQIVFAVSYNEEFRVNTYYKSHQMNQNIISLSDGGLVICWESDGQEEFVWESRGIYAQIFGVAGNKLGDEFQVNTFRSNDQKNPKISLLSDDRFVICWQSYRQDESVWESWGIYAQIFKKNGEKIGVEIQVNTYTKGKQINPVVSQISNDKFVICWESIDQDGSSYGVYAQIFSDSGEKIGEEFRVNSYTPGQQYAPRILLLSSENFVVYWISDGQDGSIMGIYAQIFNDLGEKVGEEFLINTHTKDKQDKPVCLLLSNGHFIVCWQSNGQDGSEWGIYAQIFNESGEKIGEEFRINTQTDRDQYDPQIALLSDNKFIISWSSYSQDGSGYGIFAQIYNKSGIKIGEEFQVNTYTERSQYNSKITLLPNDQFIIIWISDEQDGSKTGVYGQIFNESGEKIGEEFRVNTYTENIQEMAKIKSLSNKKFIICWQSYKQDGSRFGLYAKYFLSEVIAHTLSDFSPLSPQVDETIKDPLPIFFWNEASDIHVNFPWEITYDLYLSKTSDFSSPLIYTDLIDTTYTIPDELNRNQIYYWKVLAHTWKGDSLWSSDVGGFFVSATAAIDDDVMNIPLEFKLHNCYPNPFNAATTIRYDLPENRNVKVAIYNSLGKKVDVLVNEFQQAGSYKYSWTANNLPSGIYFISVEADNFSDVSKCVLLK